MSSNEEEEYEVDRIINDRVEKGEKQYLIRWKNFGADDDTWEPVSNLDCPEIIEAYERAKKAKTNEEKEKQDRIKRESYSRANPTKEPAKKKSKKDDNAGPTGWKRGLNPEKIIGATDESGSLMFLMKWEGAELAELVPAKEANVKCPQIVDRSLIMKSLLELVQIYLHVGNDGSDFAQLQIYQMLIRNMKISDHSKVISKHHTLDDLEEKIIDCIREMREYCYQQTGSQTLFSQSGDESQPRKGSTEVPSIISSMVRPRNTAMKRLKRRIISHDRPEMNSSDGSDSFDESEVNRNRAHHIKNRGPGLFDLIRQRKQRQIAIKDSGNDGQVSHQQKCDDRLVEPEIVPEEKSSQPDTADRVFSKNQPQDKSFEITGDNSSNKHSSEHKKSEKLAITKSLNNSKIPVPFPSSSDETDSEKNELLKQATTSGHSKVTVQNSTENSIRQNSKDNTGDSSKKPTESATVIGSSSSSDSDFNKTPKSSPKQNKTPARQHDQTPSKPANESLTKKKLISDNCRNSADTDSGSENEQSSVGESKLKSVKQLQNSRKKKVSPKRKNRESESEEDEEESTSSAKLLARTAARKGTHDPTRTTAIIRSKISGKNETTHSSSDCSSSDSENEKKSTSLNSSQKLPQTKSQQLTSNPVDSSDSSSEEVDVSKSNLQEKTTREITSKPPPTENKSISKMKEASEDSSSSDDEMFKMIKAKRQNSRAGSVHGSIQSVKHVSSDSDTDSDQFSVLSSASTKLKTKKKQIKTVSKTSSTSVSKRVRSPSSSPSRERSVIAKNDKKKPKENAKSRAKEMNKTPKKRPKLAAKSPRLTVVSGQTIRNKKGFKQLVTKKV